MLEIQLNEFSDSECFCHGNISLSINISFVSQTLMVLSFLEGKNWINFEHASEKSIGKTLGPTFPDFLSENSQRDLKTFRLEFVHLKFICYLPTSQPLSVECSTGSPSIFREQVFITYNMIQYQRTSTYLSAWTFWHICERTNIYSQAAILNSSWIVSIVHMSKYSLCSRKIIA